MKREKCSGGVTGHNVGIPAQRIKRLEANRYVGSDEQSKATGLKAEWASM